MPQSNINLMYETIVADLAERAKMIMDEDGGTDDETDAIFQAIDEGLIYTSDQAYIVAHAYCNGLFVEETDANGKPIHRGSDWGRQLDWDAINEDLFQDITDELEHLRGQD